MPITRLIELSVQLSPSHWVIITLVIVAFIVAYIVALSGARKG